MKFIFTITFTVAIVFVAFANSQVFPGPNGYLFPEYGPGQLFPGSGPQGIPRQCPLNEIWQDCGTACPPTCFNKLPICPLPCVAGCQCNLGWVRDFFNECIPATSC